MKWMLLSLLTAAGLTSCEAPAARPETRGPVYGSMEVSIGQTSTGWHQRTP